MAAGMRLRGAFVGLCVLLWAGCAAAEQRLWIAGGFSFSDELGGFTILSVSGSGTMLDPAVVVQEFSSASPVTLVIRSTEPGRPFTSATHDERASLYLRIVIVNGSGVPWEGFEFELQEELAKPSIFGDGLSFDQRRADQGYVGSDLFPDYDRRFEPYDRLLYLGGTADPRVTVRFSFLITDVTPIDVFYLVQDPRIPSV